MKANVKIILLVICGAIFTKISAQFKFQISSHHDKDSAVWYIKNLNNQTIKLGAATCDFFYQTPNLVVWPYWYFGGNRYNQRSGKFCGEKYCWKYRTEIGLGLDAYVEPGDSFPIISGDNYAAADFDTLMLANFELYFSDTSGKTYKTTVAPPNSNCDFISLFMSAGDLPNKGIKTGSNAYFQLHEGSKKYIFDVNVAIAILFKYSNLNRYYSAGVIPQNPAGRMWKDFGYPIDSQVFYQFYMMDASGKKTGTLDSIIDGMSSGDYIALVSYNMFNLNASVYGSTFARIGVDMASFSGLPCITLLGRRDLAKGLAPVKGAAEPLVGAFLKIPIIANQPKTECLYYPSCYEKSVFKLNPYVVKETGALNSPKVTKLSVYPNPSSEGNWNIVLPTGSRKIEVFDCIGQSLFKEEIAFGYQGYMLTADKFNGSQTGGMYFLRVYNSSHELIGTGRILK